MNIEWCGIAILVLLYIVFLKFVCLFVCVCVHITTHIEYYSERKYIKAWNCLHITTNVKYYSEGKYIKAWNASLRSSSSQPRLYLQEYDLLHLVFSHCTSLNCLWYKWCWVSHVWGPLPTRARTMRLWQPKRQCVKVVPRHFQNHVVWSRTLKCTMKSYVTGPSTKCNFDEFLFMWVLTYD
jgi:hypothetical protein